MGTLSVELVWPFRIQSKGEKHKGVFGKQSKPGRWHQKSTLLGLLILSSKSIGVLSTMPVTGQSLFLQTWSLRDVPKLGAPVSTSWLISSHARYWVLIRNTIWMLATRLHLLWWMLPLTRGTEARWNGAVSARLMGWGMSDNGSSQNRDWATAQRCAHIPSFLQSQELTHAPVQYPCPSHRAWCTGLTCMG